MKELEEMTLQELWQLFPIFLTEPREDWKVWFEEERAYLFKLLEKNVCEIEHIGSTAIRDIRAKPIVDILMIFSDVAEMKNAALLLTQNGYRLMSKEEHRYSLNKGYTKNGFAERVFHVHLRLQGDVDEIYFRDYLNKNQDVAKEYERLKLSLWKKYEHDRDGYTQAKTQFVVKYTQIAKAELKK